MATKEQKLELIRENLAEVLNPEIIDEVLDKGETLRIYWGEQEGPPSIQNGMNIFADKNRVCDNGQASLRILCSCKPKQNGD